MGLKFKFKFLIYSTEKWNKIEIEKVNSNRISKLSNTMGKRETSYKQRYSAQRNSGQDPYDYHMWVENKDGSVAFDPYFPEYDNIKQIHNLYGEPQYNPYRGVRAKKQFEISKRLETKASKMGWNPAEWNPLVNFCPLNAISYLAKTGRWDECVLQIGGMGWKKVGADGKGTDQVWWEFGDGNIDKRAFEIDKRVEIEKLREEIKELEAKLGFVAGPFKKLTRNQRRRLKKKKLKQEATPPTAPPSLGFMAGPFKKDDHPEDNSPHSYCEICDCCVLCECCECNKLI